MGVFVHLIGLKGEYINELYASVENRSETIWHDIKSFHMICEIIDNGIPNLTSYQRIIINSK